MYTTWKDWRKKKVKHSDIAASDTDNKGESIEQIDSSTGKISSYASPKYGSLKKQRQIISYFKVELYK
jgi:hypothetical protein